MPSRKLHPKGQEYEGAAEYVATMKSTSCRALLATIAIFGLLVFGRATGAAETDPAEIAEIIAGLSDQDPNLRAAAAQRAAALKDVGLLDALVRSLSDTDTIVRIRAAGVMAHIPGDRATQATIRNLAHADPAVRGALYHRFLVQQALPDHLLPILRTGLADADNTVRLRAASALRKISGKAAAAETLKAIKHSDPAVRGQAVFRFIEMPDLQARDSLIAALDDMDNNVRSRAAAALAKLDDPRARSALAAFKSREEKKPNANSLVAAAKSPAQLAKLLQHRDANVRKNAALALRKTPGDQANGAAFAAFEHPDPAVRIHVIYRFAEKPDAAATAALSEALNDTDSSVRGHAALALRKTPGDPAASAAFAALNHFDPAVRGHLVYRFVEKPTAQAAPALSKALNDTDSTVRKHAAAALRKTPGEPAAQSALAAFQHADSAVRGHVVYRFVEIPDARASASLIKLLDDWDNAVRLHAISALNYSGDAQAIGPLFALIDDDDAQVRQRAGAALRALAQRFGGEAAAMGKSPFDQDEVLRWLQPVARSSFEPPSAYVEMLGGDRFAGRVVGYVNREEALPLGLPPHLLVEPQDISVLPMEESNLSPSSQVRVLTRWIRRVVWQHREGAVRYRPGTVLLRDGRQIEFRSIRWNEHGIVLLTAAGTQRIGFAKIAELHSPAADTWTAYYEQLAMAGAEPSQQLLRITSSDGSRVTVANSRFLAFAKIDATDPAKWVHAFQPAWSLDVLSLPHDGTWLRSKLSATDVPLFPPDGYKPQANSRFAWQADRNVFGRSLISASRHARWGFGMHADDVLPFQLPPAAVSVESLIGLDQSVGRGGCARGIVRLRQGDRLTQLYKSPFLIGSDKIHATGTLKVPSLERSAILELVADSSHAERPPGADPLNVRDFVNWSEPQLKLDADRLGARVSAHRPKLIAAQTGWRLPDAEVEDETFDFTNPWWSDSRSMSQMVLVVKKTPATISRTITAGRSVNQLMLHVWRTDGGPDSARFEISIDGAACGIFEIPVRHSPQLPLPISVPLRLGADRKCNITIRHLDTIAEGEIYWRSVSIDSKLPSLLALFEDHAALTPVENDKPAEASLLEQNAYSGSRAIKLAPGGRIKLPLHTALKIREKPGEDAFRYLRFAFRKTGGGRVSLALNQPAEGEPLVRYDAGAGEPAYGPSKKIWAAGVPDEWIMAEVDLFADWGETELNSLILGVPDGEYALIDCIYLARTQQDFAKASGVPSLAETNIRARRALAKPILDVAEPAIVSIEIEGRRGTGVLIGDRGYVLTSGDVAGGSGSEATVRFANDVQFKGRTVDLNQGAPFGLIQLEKVPKFAGLTLSDQEKLPDVGIYVGLSYSPHWYGAKQPASYVTIINKKDEKTIQPDYTVSGAWLGGPLFDAKSRIIGIHTATDSSGNASFSRVNALKLKFPE